MPEYAQDALLVEGEKVVYHGRIHPVTALRVPLHLLLVPFVFSLLDRLLGNLLPPLPAAVVVLWLAALVAAVVTGYITVISSEFTVTTRRAVFKIGLFGRRTLEMLLERVESTSVDQGVLGRVFGYGDLVITGTGGSKEVFRGVANPLGLRRALMQQLEKALAGLRKDPPR